MAQNWQRDDGPCIGLGETGAFDDMHLFAPCVAYEKGIYLVPFQRLTTDRTSEQARDGERE